MAVSLTSIRDLLLPGLWAFTGQYDQLPKVCRRVFKTKPSTLAVERTVAMRYLPVAQIKGEGAPTTFDNASGQRYVFNQEHHEISLGFAITRKAIDDNQYKSEFGPSVMGLRDAFVRAEEIFAADVLNTSDVYNAQIGGDGVALLSASHPVDGGTYGNIASPAQSLNEASLLNAQVAINANFRDEANQRMNAKPKQLIIPPQLEPIAVRLLKTELRPGTGNNDVNAILSVQGGVPDGYVVWNYLTSEFAWYLQTNVPGLVYAQRVAFETDMSVEFTTDNLLVKGYQRYSFSYNNPRALYGSRPTS